MQKLKKKLIHQRADITDDQIAETYVKCAGNKVRTAKALGMSRQTLWHRIKNNPELKDRLDDAWEGVVDEVEYALLELTEEKQFNAIQFFLKCKAKNRGYGDKVEVTQFSTQHSITSDMTLAEAMKAYQETLSSVKNSDDQK